MLGTPGKVICISDRSLSLEWYKTMTSIRAKYDVFSTGKWIPVYAEGDAYGYIRRIDNGKDVFGEQCEDNTAFVLVNRNKDSKCHISIDIGRFIKGIMYDLLEDSEAVDIGEGRLDITLEPMQGKLFIEKP
jgi:4-alpha-glucanotransferase